MQLTFKEVQESFSYKGYSLEKVGKEYHCDDLVFKNLQQALDWFEKPVEDIVEDSEQSKECENDLVVPVIEKNSMFNLTFEDVLDLFEVKGYSLEARKEGDYSTYQLGDLLSFETLENAFTWIQNQESTPGDVEESPAILEIKFSDIKNAVKFFASTHEKNLNAVQISKTGFRYAKAFYKVSLELSETFYINFEQLKTFANLYTGREFSNIQIDFANQVISGSNLQLPLVKVDMLFSEVDENNFSDLVKVKSDDLKILVTAASKNKRESELQVVNFKSNEFLDGSQSVELASTDGCQLYLMNHSQKSRVAIKDIQIKSEIVAKFLNFANQQVTFETLGTQLLMSSGRFTLISQFSDSEFVDYLPMFDAQIKAEIGFWNIRFLEKISKLIKKISDKTNSEIKFFNQGELVKFEITLYDNLISSGTFPQSKEYTEWENFIVGTNEFYNLLNNLKDCKNLRFSQIEESLLFEISEKKVLKFILLTHSVN
jgi:hypothetical protein